MGKPLEIKHAWTSTTVGTSRDLIFEIILNFQVYPCSSSHWPLWKLIFFQLGGFYLFGVFQGVFRNVPALRSLGSADQAVSWCLMSLTPKLGGGFKYFLISPLLGEDSHFD